MDGGLGMLACMAVVENRLQLHGAARRVGVIIATAPGTMAFATHFTIDMICIFLFVFIMCHKTRRGVHEASWTPRRPVLAIAGNS